MLPAKGALLGIDLGTRTIGVALSDAERRLAGPGPVIRRTKQANDLQRIIAEVKAGQAVGVVLGLPLNMDGSAGGSAQRSRAFSRSLEGELELPILLWDERLSSETAQEAMLEAGIPRMKRRERIDAFAAAAILQSALDALDAYAPGA